MGLVNLVLSAALLASLLVACGGDGALSEDEYIDQHETRFEELGNALNRVEDAIEEALARPGLFTNDDWVEELSDHLDDVRSRAEEVIDLNPPDSYEDAHSDVRRASECWADFASSVDEDLSDDPTLILENIGEHEFDMQSCNELTRDADAALDASTN